MPWERYVKKDGRKDVRVKGAASDSLYDPKQYKAAKAAAVAAEKREKALADAKRLFAVTRREVAAKGGGRGVPSPKAPDKPLKRGR